MQMFDKEKTYKVKWKGLFYTCKVIAEDDYLISIKTLRGEEKQLSKSDIAESWPVRGETK